MRRLQPVSIALAIALVGSPALAQEFQEYEPLEGETERHQPTLGLETEYEADGDVDVETEDYEWEAGEGYHEEEWYDPSDWFDVDTTVDYEDGYDGFWGYDDDVYEEAPYAAGYGTYDDVDVDYGYHYDAVTNDYDYGWHYDDVVDYDYFDYDYDYGADTEDNREDIDYEFNEVATGTVVGLERFRPQNGKPESVRLKFKTEDGETKTVLLGDLAYVDRYLPRIEKGDSVVVGGSFVNKKGRRMFKAEKILGGEREYLIPEYQYRRRIQGEVVGMKRVAASDGAADRLVARVRTGDDKVINVMLGTPKDMNEIRRNLGPGTKARIEGYRREVGDEATFVVQNVKVMNRSSNQMNRSSNQSNR